MIEFYCKCGQKINVPKVHGGKKGRCPKCKQVIAIPKASQVASSSIPHNNVSANTDREIGELDGVIGEMLEHRNSAPEEYVLAEDAQPTKSCPFCGEEILATSKKCRHCREFLDGGTRQASQGSVEHTPRSQTVAQRTGTGPGRGKAVGSLVCGILAIVTGPLGFILALVAISLGRSATRDMVRGKSRDGYGMATAGLILGIIMLVLYVIVVILLAVVILLPAQQRARGETQATWCATRLKGLDTSLFLYAEGHKNEYPDARRWREILIEEDYVPSSLFLCPSVDGDPEKDNHYVLVPWPGPDDVDGDLLVIFESKANHSGRRSVVGGDHVVRTEYDLVFEMRLASTIEALAELGIEFDWQE